jgi:hypothetical protein
MSPAKLISQIQASVDSIILDYHAGNVKGIFTCGDNSV